MVFVCSMGDLFHPRVPWKFIDNVFVTMALTPQHTYQLLTKRPGRMAWYFNSVQADMDAWPLPVGKGAARIRLTSLAKGLNWAWPFPNVWAGTSVESAKYLPRLDVLARVSAPVRFVSLEPMLGPVDLRPWLGNHICNWDDLVGTYDPACRYCRGTGHMINWVILGGESGPGARPMHPDWARSVRDQCQEAGVPFFFKQWGEWAPEQAAGLGMLPYPKREHLFDGPFCRVQRWGRRAAGALLDGVAHRGMP